MNGCLRKLMCFLFMLTIASQYASAYTPDEAFQYTIADNQVTITKFIGSQTEVSIPPTIEGKPIVAIGDSAFYNNTNVTFVTIPKGVTTIGNFAFRACSSLTSVTIPEGMTTIGNAVFSGCSSLTSVTIPTGVTIIGNFVFASCSSLASVSIPSSVGSIGNFAFGACSSLTTVTIPSNIDLIGTNAFQGCTSLTDMDFDGFPPIFSSACYPTPITFHVPAGKGWEDWTVPSDVTLDIRHELHTQTLELSTGWNWVSFNVLPESRKVGDVLGTEGFSLNDIIQTNGGMARFTGTSWMPGSFTVEYGKLYQIYVANEAEAVVGGEAEGPLTVPLVAGWNWIANSTSESVTPAELVHSGGWSAGDRIQSPAGAVIHTGSKWVPATGFTLEAGKGYQIYTANEGTLSFQTSEYVDDDDALYVVVDISDGPDATSYPVRYTNTAPNLDDNTCRTTELWLRRIPAGSFMMGSPEDEVWRNGNETQHEVTLTQDYYVGVFECTQKQWELVMGNNPSTYKGYFCPVEGVSYDMIRGSGEQEGAGWPTYGHTVDASSFMGKLQEKTGLTFDLPTEAQWEYACRAGTTTAFNSGKNMVKNGNNDEILQVGRFGANESDGKGGHLQHTKVGCYLPNAWGLFDMHGNVYEWCLDWYGAYDTEAVEDPQGGITGSKRVWRGGGWFNVAEGSEMTLGDLSDCRSASRYSWSPNIGSLVGFRVACYPKQNLYAVVDLSGGPDAASYPVRYTNTAPNLDDDTCRTTELWLRRIPAGTFMMGAQGDEVGRYDNETQHEVTLTQDFYIGVFECTQRQWKLVMGSNPSHFNGDCRPVESISYEMIRGRGEQDGAGWPMYGHVVNSTSFMGKLQEKTGLMFDLPTEAQWEYVCRAGTTTALNSGKNLTQPTGEVEAMNEVGRYYFNQTDGIGDYSEHTTVGNYRPNVWGLYDMHGNVLEWCLDWYGGYFTNAVSDPVGPSSGSGRVVRGGSWSNYVRDCRSAGKRYGSGPSYSTSSHGFRIACLP